MKHRNDRRWQQFVPAAATLLVVLIAAPIAWAARGERGDWELGLFAGYANLDDYERDGAPALRPKSDVLYGARFGFFFNPSFSLETSYQYLSTQTDYSVSSANRDIEQQSVRLNALYNIGKGNSFRPFLTIGAGYEFFDAENTYKENDPSLNAGAGLRWFLGRTFGLRLDARYVYHNASGDVSGGQSNFEASFGLLWAFGGGPPPDSDGDGVPDKRDRCPATPRGALVDEFGCPHDTDGDGVYDGIDQCPGTPPGAVVDERGCPVDSDGDGVYDGIDQCPGTPPGATVDERGCPADSDGDGVYDGIDQCPDTPPGAVVDERGCPIDSDGDGVYDGIDQCPGTEPGVEVNAVGCKVLFVQGEDTLVLKGVSFAFDSAVLSADSRDLLDSVAVSLNQVPDARIEVAGHTDSRGNADYNLLLSQRRAEAVRDYLISKGVDVSRVVAKGFGESEPVADNATEAGRAMNRRVVLRKLD